MVTLEKIIELGNALARSIGHHPNCPKLSPTIPCICKSTRDQAKALDDWQHIMEEIRNGEKLSP